MGITVNKCKISIDLDKKSELLLQIPDKLKLHVRYGCFIVDLNFNIFV